jgi:hypothetical protein
MISDHFRPHHKEAVAEMTLTTCYPKKFDTVQTIKNANINFLILNSARVLPRGPIQRQPENCRDSVSLNATKNLHSNLFTVKPNEVQ